MFEFCCSVWKSKNEKIEVALGIKPGRLVSNKRDNLKINTKFSK